MNITDQSSKIFISYSHDSSDHDSRVLEFSNSLRNDGIDAIIDQYVQSPEEGWPLWMERQIKHCDFILMICTNTYKRRAEAEEEEGIGLGGQWESKLIRTILYNSAGINNKIISILLHSSELPNIPFRFQEYQRFIINEFDFSDNGYESLYRLLTSQPLIEKPVIGKLKSLPKLNKEKDFTEVRMNIPISRNPYFSGREDILNLISNKLNINKKAAIFGLGGCGKTQIALKIALTNTNKYKYIFWVNADTDLSVISDYKKILQLLNIQISNLANKDEACKLMKDWLERNRNWLLVYDNADNPELLLDYLPSHPDGHMLFTSRANTFDMIGVDDPVEVLVFSQEESLNFLLHRTNRDISKSEELKSAHSIVNNLGGLPLALEQAGAYIAFHKSSFESYFKSFEVHRIKLLERRLPMTGNYSASIATTWSLNFQAIKEQSNASSELLYFFSLLAPHPIPVSLLIKSSSELGDSIAESLFKYDIDPLSLNELLSTISRYSLIEVNYDTDFIIIHRLVQEVIRTYSLDEELKKLWMFRIVKALSVSFPDAKFSNWNDCEKLLPHIIQIIPFLMVEKKLPPVVNRLLFHCGHYFKEQGMFNEAQELLILSVSISSSLHGHSSKEVAASLNELADTLYRSGCYEESLEIFQQVINIDNKFNNYEIQQAKNFSRNGIGDIYRSQSRYVEAEEYYKAAINDIVNQSDIDYEWLSNVQANLAITYSNLRKFSESESLYLEALNNIHALVGDQNPEYAKILSNLGKIYSKQGKYERALIYFEDSHDILKNILKNAHPTLGLAKMILGECYLNLQRPEEAAPFLEEAYKIILKCYGLRHIYTASILDKLGLLCLARKQYGEAEKFYIEAISIVKSIFSDHHHFLGHYYWDLAEVYTVLGSNEKAVNAYEKCYQVWDLNNSEHPFRKLSYDKYIQLKKLLDKA